MQKRPINIQKERKKDTRAKISLFLFRFSKNTILVGAMIIIITLALFEANRRLDQLEELEATEYALRAEISQLLARQEQLYDLYEYMGSLDFVEAMARERLGFVRPDEVIFRLNEE